MNGIMLRIALILAASALLAPDALAATRFKLTAANIDVTLWYSTSKDWLALESVARGSRIIRYELS